MRPSPNNKGAFKAANYAKPDTTNDEGITNPFDLVNSYGAMQSQMRQSGQGLGPNGQVRKSPMSDLRNRNLTNAYAQLQQMRQGQSFSPMPQGGGGQQSGLVDWGGRQIDSSVLGYANQIAKMFPGLRFSSGYRDPAANARANGVPNSYHLSGRALDFSGPANVMQQAKVWAQQNGAREAMIHNAGSGTHLHVAW